ncbi:hypothetical protein WG909_08395 [Peptostreptococcaceae bacterium AGR-M142]
MLRKKIMLAVTSMVLILGLTTSSFATDALKSNQKTKVTKILRKESTSRRKDIMNINDIKAGDILISDTRNKEFCGHVAIAVSDKQVIHAPSIPTDGRSINAIEKITLEEFKNQYSNRNHIMVYRYKDNENLSNNASTWVEEFYKENKDELIHEKNRDLHKINPIYSSKLVLNAYYNADHNVVNKWIQEIVEGKRAKGRRFLHPYALDNWLRTGSYKLTRVGFLYSRY